MERIIEKKMSFSTMKVCIYQIGNDYQITVEGGEGSHIGSVVMAVPRSSLTGDGTVSCTSSVLNVVGHKDEDICRSLAEKVSAAKNAVVVCSGGFHMDHISMGQVAEVVKTTEVIALELIA